MHTRFLLLLVCLILCSCMLTEFWFDHLASPPHSTLPISAETVFATTFQHEDCANPCWLGIEIDVSGIEEVEHRLEANHIEYERVGRGINYDLLLHSIDSPLWRDREDPHGFINVDSGTNTARIMSFAVDLCVSTVLDVYGVPQVSRVSPNLRLYYPKHGLAFHLSSWTRRIDSVGLLGPRFLQENLPRLELEAWDDHADEYAGECTDVFSAE